MKVKLEDNVGAIEMMNRESECYLDIMLSNGAISNGIRKGSISGGYRWWHHEKR